MTQYDFLLLEIPFFIIGIFAAMTTFKQWKESKNRIVLAIIIYIAAILFISFVDIVIYAFDFSLHIYLIGYLTIGQVIAQFLFITQLEFIFYLKKQVKFYTLPFVISFYIMMGRALVDSLLPFIMYASIVSYGTSYILIKNGKNRRNGLAIGIGLLTLFWGIGQTIPIDIILIACKLVGMIALLLGTRGFYEKYVFVNVQEEDRILNTWISKLVVNE
jgi:hypothetical protein